jgi:hypothetical protein
VRRSGLRLAPWEIALLEALDDIYLSPEPKAEVPEAPEGQTVKAAASARDGAGVKSVLGSSASARSCNARRGRQRMATEIASLGFESTVTA